MINKIYKRILDKYSVFFKFLFYLKYLFLIFFISIILFLLIPKFFDYEKKAIFVENFVFQDYKLKIKEFDNIKFNIFPTPNLEVENATLDLNSNNLSLKTKKLYIYPKIINLYNFENFNLSKIQLEDSEIDIKFKDLKKIYNNLLLKEKKIKINDLKIKLYNNNLNPIISVNNINYSNYGYNKNQLKGKIFEKHFKIEIKDNLEKIRFKILETGIFAEINNVNSYQNTKTGDFKGKILNSNLKFNYNFDDSTFRITNSFFRNKLISFESTGEVTYKPYLSINLDSSIKDIKKEIFKNISFENLLIHKDLIKKISTKNNIVFKPKKFSRNLISELDINFSLAYGRITFKKIMIMPGGEFSCSGEANLIEEYPIVVFDCLINSNDKKKFLKNFLLKYKTKNEIMNLNVKGNLNIIPKKINFLDIKVNNSYVASQEDLKFFKNSFEKILLSENILNIFNVEKLNKFILDIS